MPLVRKITVENGIIGLWKITEHPEDFSRFYSILKDDPAFKKIKHKKRKTEFLATRALVEELTGQFPKIGYNADGSPVLSNSNKNISISHSANMVAVILHKNRAGIDVERLDRPVVKIAHKFLSAEELEFAQCTEAPEKIQTTCWCAKEAIFKWAPIGGVDFISQIKIQPFQMAGNGIINAGFFHQKHYKLLLSYLIDSDNVVVWCIKNYNE